jgi:hypothetical protein
MLWLLQNIIFSISLIVVIHYLYIYFETTLTAPKVKDLIHCPKQKYKSLFDTINKNLDVSRQETIPRTQDEPRDLGTVTSTSEYSEKPKYKETSDMKTDLKAFLRGIGLKTNSKSDSPFRPSYEIS